MQIDVADGCTSVDASVDILIAVIVGGNADVVCSTNGSGRIAPFDMIIVKTVIYGCGICQPVGVKSCLIILYLRKS